MTSVPRPFVLVLLSSVLMACVSEPDGAVPKASLDEAMSYRPDPVPARVESELLAGARQRAGRSAVLPVRRFDISASEVDAQAFFAALGAEQGVSIVVHPEVSGLISLNLRQATLSEALEAVAAVYGFGIRQQGNIHQVLPAGLRTETFSVNYLMLNREGLSQTSISGSSLAEGDNGSGSNSGTRINTSSNNDFWADLAGALSRLIGAEEGRTVVTNPQAGLVSVRANPEELAQVAAFLERAERQLKRQVILEARIIEVELNKGYEQGIDWSNLTAGSSASRSDPLVTGGSALTYPTGTLSLNPIANLLGGGALFRVTDGNFNTVISLLESQGNVNTLSNPRVTASNNQKAVIKVGTDEYFVTDFSVTTTTGTSTTTTPEVELTPFFSGIALDVTPQIAGDNRVLLHVHPSVTNVEEREKIINLGSDSNGNAQIVRLPLARSSIRESDTVVEARSGELIVIGGLMQSQESEQNTKVPLLGDIPFLGELFKNRSTSTTKSELVILLRPVVVNDSTWQHELQRSRSLLDKWYP